MESKNLSAVGCWDEDFLFDNTSTSSETAAVGRHLQQCEPGVRSTSGTNEDWDMELSLGEKTPEALVLKEEAEDGTVAAAPSDSSVVAFSDEQQQMIASTSIPSSTASLLEYLDGYMLVDTVTYCAAYRMRALPRQPTLFSSYAAYRRQRDKDESSVGDAQHGTNTAMSQRPESTSPPLEKMALIKTPNVAASDSAMFTVATGTDTHASAPSNAFSTAHFSSPHAPESALGTVAWLQNLCYKVSHTSAVVARPSPERVGNIIERERSPSEEAALERALRAAEMAYCNGNWRDCGTRAKALLRRLEKATRATPSALRVVSFGDGFNRPISFDDDLRCHQCCGRLARLVCRLAQRQDELCAVELLRSTKIRRRFRLDSLESNPPPLNAGDIASFRRGMAALVNDIDDNVLKARSKLLVDEALAHLALVHMRTTRRSACERMRGEEATLVGRTSQTFGGGCWCGALPPLPRSGIAGALDATHLLRGNLCIKAADELEALVLADLRLEAMGYSPLTAEKLVPDEPPEPTTTSMIWLDASTPCWNSEVLWRWDSQTGNVSDNNSVACESGAALESALEGKWSSRASGRVEGRLVALISVLPPSSLARAKAALALGLGHLRGVERLRDEKVVTMECKDSPVSSDEAIQHKIRRGHKALHAATQELRIAEMLLFEATCVLEQHTTTEPVDLPFHAHRYESPLDPASPTQNDLAPTAYSVLACSMGYTALRALARALERRSKHAYAVLVLDVCVAILRLRDDSNEWRRLQRELCVISTRQDNHETGAAHCKHVLGDLRESFEDRRTRVLAHQIEDGTESVQTKSQMDSAVILDVYEIFFATELLSAQYAGSSNIACAYATLRELEVNFVRRKSLCSNAAAIHELRLALQGVALSAASIAVEQCEPASAVLYLECALARCPTSPRRRVAALSYLAEAKLSRGDAAGAQLLLRRISRLRWRDVGASMSHPPWTALGVFAGDLYQPLWDAPVKGKLVSFCNDNVDLGQLAAEIALLEGRSKRALKKLAPTVAAVEAAVSRVGSVRGLGELGALYELRGRAQVALAREAGATAFPLRLHGSDGDSDELSRDHQSNDIYHRHCQADQLVMSSIGDDLGIDNQTIIDETSRRSRSRHYRSYGNAVDVRIDALRWYRHALECFKATDDSFGTARAASAFATLNLDTMFLDTTLISPLARPVLYGTHTRLKDVNLAARHALDIAAVMDEPLLLLEAYLNVAELRHVRDDPLGAIAHWWEARELLLRLFVDDVLVPLATVADAGTLMQLRRILERLLRFLAAVADKAMIDENLILFDVFVIFERDAYRTHRGHPFQSRVVDLKASGNVSSIIDADPQHSKEAFSCWRSIVRTRADVGRHRRGKLTLGELQDRNRDALRELAATMRRLRLYNKHAEAAVSLHLPTAYAVHAAGALIVYAPHLGWRHALTFGRSERGLEAAGASLVGAFAGARRVIAKRNGVEHRRAVLKQIDYAIALPCNFFSTAFAAEGKKLSVATLVCSERAQVLPWECISDIAISRILCVSYHFTSPMAIHTPCSSNTTSSGQSFTNAWSLSLERIMLDDARHIVDSIVNDLSSSMMGHSDDGRCSPRPLNDGNILGDITPRTNRIGRPLKCHLCCSLCSTSAEMVSPPSFPFRVFPLSMLYATPEKLLQLQVNCMELLFAPDAVVGRVTSKLLAEYTNTKGARIAKDLSDNLALPIVHSLPRPRATSGREQPGELDKPESK